MALNLLHSRGGRLQGDAAASTDAAASSDVPVNLAEWNTEVDDDDEGVDDVGPAMRFGEDQVGWKWVVGISNGKGRVRFVRVPNRKANTLNAINNKYVAPGSVIHTDCWKGCSQLGQLGCKHKTVTHKENFVNPNSGAHTQEIERWWVEVRAWWKRSRGSKKLLQTHLDFISWMALHESKKT